MTDSKKPSTKRRTSNRFANLTRESLNKREKATVKSLAIAILKHEHSRGKPFINTLGTREYLRLKMSELPNEEFGVLFLDNRHRLIALETMFKGTINGATVYPRVVAQKALQHNAGSIICYHNHPSGAAEPSQSDIAITKRLKQALDLLDIRLLDHLVVATQGVTSLAERQLI